MTAALTFEKLSARAERADGEPDPAAQLALALERAGWPPGPEAASAYEAASFLWHVVDACVHGHQDVSQLERDAALLLRDMSRPPGAVGGPLRPPGSFADRAAAALRAWTAD